MSQNRRWINTRVEYQWNGTEYVEVSVEGYWYDGPMALAHNNPSIDQDSYAFYNDGTESGSTIIGSANSAQTLDSDTTYLIRFLIQEQGGASSNNFASQLEYDVNNSGTWNNVTSTSNNVRAVVSSNLGTDGSNTTQRLGAGTFISANAGVDNGDGAAGSTSFAGNDEFEAVFAIQFRNADLTDQDTVQLRVAGCDVYTNTASATINVSLGAITGTMTAQEAGTDAFAATGDVDVSGSLVAQESGSDAFAASGSVPASGTLAAQETGSDTFAASGVVTDPPITGTLSAQESGSDTFTATGAISDPAILATMAAQESGSDTFAGSGAVTVAGTLNAQESGVDTLSASGSVSVSGSLVATESGADTFSASGTVSAPSIIGAMTAQEGGVDTLSASGNVALTGSLSSRESGADTLYASGGVAVVGTLAAQETGAGTFSATGALINGIVGTMAAQESGADTITAGGEVIVGGTLSVQEAGVDIASIIGLVRNYRGQQGTDSNHVKGSSGITAHGASGAMTIRMGVTNNTVAMPASRPIKVQND